MKFSAAALFWLVVGYLFGYGMCVSHYSERIDAFAADIYQKYGEDRAKMERVLSDFEKAAAWLKETDNESAP